MLKRLISEVPGALQNLRNAIIGIEQPGVVLSCRFAKWKVQRAPRVLWMAVVSQSSISCKFGRKRVSSLEQPTSSLIPPKSQLLSYIYSKTCVCRTLYQAESCTDRTHFYAPKCCGSNMHPWIKRNTVISGKFLLHQGGHQGGPVRVGFTVVHSSCRQNSRCRLT